MGTRPLGCPSDERHRSAGFSLLPVWHSSRQPKGRVPFRFGLFGGLVSAFLHLCLMLLKGKSISLPRFHVKFGSCFRRGV